MKNTKKIDSQNFTDLISSYQDQLITDLQKLLQINSTYDPETITDTMPFGEGINQALNLMLDIAKRDGFKTYNDDGYVGIIEYGEGEPFGILCHLDVVPAGNNWTYDPFGAKIVDGKIYGRGTMDDKGPTLAAYYALRIIKDLGIKLNYKIQMILGTDEETKWRGIEHYSINHQLPEIGFAPDADFPLIYGEKGILRILLTGNCPDQIIEMTAGNRYNVVIDHAKFTLKNRLDFDFRQFCQDNNINGSQNGNTYEIEGISAHAMEPEKGKNAGGEMAKVLASYSPLLLFINKFFNNDHHLKNFSVDLDHPEMGKATANIGMINKVENKIEVGIDIRYPLDFNFNSFVFLLQNLASLYQFRFQIIENKTPHYLDPNDRLVQTLYQAYLKYTGDTVNKPKTIGGGTYARAIKKGVAFGMEFPGQVSLVHQKDEYLNISDLIKATLIYTEAIYQIGSDDAAKKL